MRHAWQLWLAICKANSRSISSFLIWFHVRILTHTNASQTILSDGCLWSHNNDRMSKQNNKRHITRAYCRTVVLITSTEEKHKVVKWIDPLASLDYLTLWGRSYNYPRQADFNNTILHSCRSNPLLLQRCQHHTVWYTHMNCQQWLWPHDDWYARVKKPCTDRTTIKASWVYNWVMVKSPSEANNPLLHSLYNIAPKVTFNFTYIWITLFQVLM